MLPFVGIGPLEQAVAVRFYIKHDDSYYKWWFYANEMTICNEKVVGVLCCLACGVML